MLSLLFILACGDEAEAPAVEAEKVEEPAKAEEPAKTEEPAIH